MNHEKILNLTSKLQDVLKGERKRFVHSVAVANTSMCMAARFGVDLEKAYIAGLLHDNAKCIDYDEQIKMCREMSVEITNFEYNNPYLIHGKLGAGLLKRDYGIEDRAIAEAVKWHTTGKPAMNKLESIVFIADFIEPMRHRAVNLDHIRVLAFDDLTATVKQILTDTIAMLKKNNRPVDPVALKAYEYYNKL